MHSASPAWFIPANHFAQHYAEKEKPTNKDKQQNSTNILIYSH